MPRLWSLALRSAAACAGSALVLACGEPPGDEPVAQARWVLVHEELDSALISVWGTSENDVWAVGADTGEGPLVMHWDGSQFRRFDTGVSADLYWVFGFAGGPVFFGGTNGTVLRYDAGAFTPLATPGRDTVFGLWGSSPEEMWAVGGAEGGSSGGFAWRLEGDQWLQAPGFPAEVTAGKAIWKVWGSGADDVWLVGSAGLAVHFDGQAFAAENLGGGESIFTVHYAAGEFAAVGGFATGLVFENSGMSWQRADTAVLPGLVGVCLTSGGEGYAVGSFGAFVERRGTGWHEAEGPPTTETLHAIWADPSGGLWAVGGQVQVQPLVRGLLAYRGDRVPTGEL